MLRWDTFYFDFERVASLYIYVPCDEGKLLILLVGRFPSINVLYD